MNLRARQIFAKDALRVDGAPRAEKLIGLFEDGSIRERFSDMPEGEWYVIEPPKRQQHSRAKRKKR